METKDGKPGTHLFLTCHMQCRTAKKSKGFCADNDTFWETVKDIVLKYPVDFITGDFNMSLWQVCPQLRINHPATTIAGMVRLENGGRRFL